jgi:PadR family transcriptional regulator, regulatory protein AphA
MSPMLKQPLSLELALLGFLWEEPQHAYEIHRHLQEHRALGLVWRMKQSQCYALLGRLEEAGYLVSTTEPQGNRPPRKLLALTPAGRAAFQHWLGEPVTHGRDFRQEFLAKLYFVHQGADAELLTQLLARQRTATSRVLNELQAQAATVDEPFDTLVLAFRIRQTSSILAWLEQCGETLGAPAAVP